MKKLYKWQVDFGRAGSLDGIFVGDDNVVEGDMLNETIYLGEALGKHSDVTFIWTEEKFTVIEIGQDALKTLEENLGDTWSGYNPQEEYQDRLDEEEDCDEDDYDDEEE